LTKFGISPDGKRGVIVETRDLRGEMELLTENAGRVQFRRRAAKTTLRRALRDIAAFAERAASDAVTKIIGQGRGVGCVGCAPIDAVAVAE
jgi:hypothetical protein